MYFIFYSMKYRILDITNVNTYHLLDKRGKNDFRELQIYLLIRL